MFRRPFARGGGAANADTAGAAAAGDGVGGCICAASTANMSSRERARPRGLGSGLASCPSGCFLDLRLPNRRPPKSPARRPALADEEVLHLFGWLSSSWVAETGRLVPRGVKGGSTASCGCCTGAEGAGDTAGNSVAAGEGTGETRAGSVGSGDPAHATNQSQGATQYRKLLPVLGAAHIYSPAFEFRLDPPPASSSRASCNANAKSASPPGMLPPDCKDLASCWCRHARSSTAASSAQDSGACC